MILTYKVRHKLDFSDELRKARKVAAFAIATRCNSSAAVKHIGLNSVISNQIIRKYSRNRKCKNIRNVVLTVPGQGIKVDKDTRIIKISSLKLQLSYMFNNDFEKINQIELDTEYAYVSVSFNEPPPYEPGGFIGVDLNTTGHCAVVANPLNGDVFKFGKSAQHTHEKYSAMRRGLQKKGKLRRLKKTRNRESRKIRDMNQKISRRIVSIAKENNCGIRMEALDGIHQRAKSTKSFRYSLNSWSFYQIRSMVEYKAKLLGVPVEHIDPRYTSQLCSRCGCMGNRNGKEFECRHCGHVDNADVNASFNIALRQEGVYQSGADRVVSEGNTDIPKGAPLRTMATLELP